MRRLSSICLSAVPAASRSGSSSSTAATRTWPPWRTLDAEVFSCLARLHRAGELDDTDEVADRLGRLGDLTVTRLPITTTLMRAVWALRDTVAARDALYVVMARALSAGLVTPTTGSRVRSATSPSISTRRPHAVG